jgi:hypothetical protein
MDANIFYIFFFLSLTITIKSDCYCGQYKGFHCGERSNDDSTGLRGNCKPNIIYECSAVNIRAKVSSQCDRCIKRDRIGNDDCALGKEGISLSS